MSEPRFYESKPVVVIDLCDSSDGEEDSDIQALPPSPTTISQRVVRKNNHHIQPKKLYKSIKEAPTQNSIQILNKKEKNQKNHVNHHILKPLNFSTTDAKQNPQLKKTNLEHVIQNKKQQIIHKTKTPSPKQQKKSDPDLAQNEKITAMERKTRKRDISEVSDVHSPLPKRQKKSSLDSAQNEETEYVQSKHNTEESNSTTNLEEKASEYESQDIVLLDENETYLDSDSESEAIVIGEVTTLEDDVPAETEENLYLCNQVVQILDNGVVYHQGKEKVLYKVRWSYQNPSWPREEELDEEALMEQFNGGAKTKDPKLLVTILDSREINGVVEIYVKQPIYGFGWIPIFCDELNKDLEKFERRCRAEKRRGVRDKINHPSPRQKRKRMDEIDILPEPKRSKIVESIREEITVESDSESEQIIIEEPLLFVCAESITCPKNHSLKIFKSYDTLLCDQCNNELRIGTTMHGCRLCDYDLCTNCYGNVKPMQEILGSEENIIEEEEDSEDSSILFDENETEDPDENEEKDNGEEKKMKQTFDQNFIKKTVEEYKIEAIIRVKGKLGERKAWIKWIGWGHEHNTWEVYLDILNEETCEYAVEYQHWFNNQKKQKYMISRCNKIYAERVTSLGVQIQVSKRENVWVFLTRKLKNKLAYKRYADRNEGLPIKICYIGGVHKRTSQPNAKLWKEKFSHRHPLKTPPRGDGFLIIVGEEMVGIITKGVYGNNDKETNRHIERFLILERFSGLGLGTKVFEEFGAFCHKYEKLRITIKKTKDPYMLKILQGSKHYTATGRYSFVYKPENEKVDPTTLPGMLVGKSVVIYGNLRGKKDFMCHALPFNTNPENGDKKAFSFKYFQKQNLTKNY